MGTSESADAQTLLQSAIGGQPGSLEALFLRYHQPLLSRIAGRLPVSLATTWSAEDVLQDAYVEAFRSFPRFVVPAREDEAVPAFFGWLAMIADRALATACRRANAAKRGAGLQAVVPGPFAHSSVAMVIDMLGRASSSSSRVAREGEAEMAVLAALEKLSEDQRRALELRYFQGMPAAQIAAHMARTEQAVHDLCARALEAMRRELGDVESLFSRPQFLRIHRELHGPAAIVLRTPAMTVKPPTSSNEPSVPRTRVQEISAAYLRDRLAGLRVSRSEVLEAHAELSEGLVDLILSAKSRAQDSMGAAAAGKASPGPQQTHGLPTLPGYELIREIQRGGQGIVLMRSSSQQVAASPSS